MKPIQGKSSHIEFQENDQLFPVTSACDTFRNARPFYTTKKYPCVKSIAGT